MPKPIDIAIINGHVLPMGDGAAIRDGIVTIADERITHVGPAGSIDISRARKVIDATNCAVLPGFVDCHTHVAPSLLTRGLHRGLAPHELLTEMAQVKEKLDFAALYWASLCGLIEMVKAGVTGFSEHFDAYRVTPQLEALRELPLRATLGYGLADRGAYSFLADYSTRTLDAFGALVQAHDNTRNGLLRIALAPHGPATCSADLVRRAREVSQRHRVPMHTHLDEVTGSELTPVQWLKELGALDTDVTLAASCALSRADIETVADLGVRVAYCPTSSSMTGQGTLSLPALLDAGVTVGLGSDGSTANHGADPFSLMRSSALLQRATGAAAASLTPEQLLGAATNGAAAASHRLTSGSLEPGLVADVIVVDLDREHTLPAHDPAAAVAFAARPDDVRHTIVDGRILMEDRVLTTVDELEVRARVREAATLLVQRGTGSGTFAP